MKRLLQSATVLSLFVLGTLSAHPDDLSKLEGKWSVSKTNDQGQSYKQVIEIKKDKFKFRLLGSDDSVQFYAEGEIKLAKLGAFNSIKFTNIKGGASESDLQPVDDDRTSIYMLDGDSWLVASNFDKDRDGQKPALEVYKKVK